MTTVAFAGYRPVDENSALNFKIANFGFDVTGFFKGLQGSINFDPQTPGSSSFDVTIDAGTVNTDNSLRDSHLVGSDFFDVKDYPRIRLVSSKVTASVKKGIYIFTGQLIIKGKSKTITFPFSAIPAMDGYVFKGAFRINRKDFGIGGTSSISNELEVTLNVHAVKA